MPGMKIKKGDLVEVTSGKYKGQQGKVNQAFPSDAKVIVDGINLVKRHRKPVGSRDPGGIVDLIKPVHVANVVLICPSCGKKTRISYEVVDGKKMRVCKACQAKF